jgi:hypothetical protein
MKIPTVGSAHHWPPTLPRKAPDTPGVDVVFHPAQPGVGT